jgi:hypothetical protein
MVHHATSLSISIAKIAETKDLYSTNYRLIYPQAISLQRLVRRLRWPLVVGGLSVVLLIQVQQQASVQQGQRLAV